MSTRKIKVEDSKKNGPYQAGEVSDWITVEGIPYDATIYVNTVDLIKDRYTIRAEWSER
jgi:hypothetical protein